MYVAQVKKTLPKVNDNPTHNGCSSERTYFGQMPISYDRLVWASVQSEKGFQIVFIENIAGKIPVLYTLEET